MKKKMILVLFFSFVAIISGQVFAKGRAKSAREQVVDRVQQFSHVEVPTDQEVCFAPDEPCDQKLIKFVESAKKTLDIAIYDINLDQLVHTLLTLSKKGISVRVIVDQRQSKGEYSLVSTLIKGGVEVRTGKQRGIMHNKFVIVDGKMVETGSFNFTNHATLANQENQVYLAQPSIVERYRSRFDKIWASSTPQTEKQLGPLFLKLPDVTSEKK